MLPALLGEPGALWVVLKCLNWFGVGSEGSSRPCRGPRGVRTPAGVGGGCGAGNGPRREGSGAWGLCVRVVFSAGTQGGEQFFLPGNVAALKSSCSTGAHPGWWHPQWSCQKEWHRFSSFLSVTGVLETEFCILFLWGVPRMWNVVQGIFSLGLRYLRHPADFQQLWPRGFPEVMPKKPSCSQCWRSRRVSGLRQWLPAPVRKSFPSLFFFF